MGAMEAFETVCGALSNPRICPNSCYIVPADHSTALFRRSQVDQGSRARLLRVQLLGLGPWRSGGRAWAPTRGQYGR